MLYEGVEIKAQYCTPAIAKRALEALLHIYGDGAQIWTHDHQTNIISNLFSHFPFTAVYLLRRRYLDVFKAAYKLRTIPEDRFGLGKHNNKGIYTMIWMVK